MQKIHRIHFCEIDSTATWVETHWKELPEDGVTCVTASVQTAGKGRRSRRWVSKKGNLHMTLFYRLKVGDPRIPNLAQIMALAFCELFPAQIKWPNDLLVNGAKLAGILVGLIDCEDAIGVVHSIGVNVHCAVQTDQSTTSLQEWTGHTYALDDLALMLSRALLQQLEMGFSHSAFNAKLAYMNQRMRCEIGGQVIEGIIRGVDQGGRLMLELPGGKRLKVDSGDLAL